MFWNLTLPSNHPTPPNSCRSFAPAQAAPILRDFAGRWKGSIEDMHGEVAKHFAHAPCGRNVLQVQGRLQGLHGGVLTPAVSHGLRLQLAHMCCR